VHHVGNYCMVNNSQVNLHEPLGIGTFCSATRELI